MIRSTRPAARLALGSLALASAGCTTPEVGPPPGPLDREIHREALHEAPPEGIRVEPRRFAEAFADYDNAVQRLLLGEIPLDEPHSGLFRRLAAVIAATPGGDLVGAPAAAESIRLDAIVLADPRAVHKPAVAARALATAAKALLGLARGPYHASPEVLARARDLVATATVVTSGEPTPALLARGLREAELTLAAIHGSLS